MLFAIVPAARTSDPEKPAHHLLPGADLRERPVPARIEIDLQRLGMRIDHFLFHFAAALALPALNASLSFLQADWKTLLLT